MAEEDLAPQGADDGAQVVDPPADQQTDDTPEPIANLARDLGWTPREEWQGEPDKWKPAEQFIRDGRDIQQTTARELRSMREQMERVGSVTESIVRDKLAERDAEWQRKMAQAVDEGDTATALKLVDERPVAKPTNGAGPQDPQVQSWLAKNPWMGTDTAAAAFAERLSVELAGKGFDTAAQLAAVEREARKRFPEHFTPPAKQPPATQTATTRSTAPSNRAKGFAEMPLASQQVALDYERRLGVPKEQTAKSYWADQQGVKR